MRHEVTTDNTALIYSIRDAVSRIETMLNEHDVAEDAPGPNELLDGLDTEAWDIHDTMEELL